MKNVHKFSGILPVISAISFTSSVFGHGANFQIGNAGNQVVTTHYFVAAVTTPSENYDPYYSGQSARVADVPMVQDTVSGVGGGAGAHNQINNNGWYGQPDLNYLESPAGGSQTVGTITLGGTAFTGPGLAYGADGNGFVVPNSGSISVTETLAAPLQVWNGSSFANSTTEQLEGIRGSIGSGSSFLYSPLPAGYTPANGSESPSWNKSAVSINSDTHNQVEWRLDSISGTSGTEMPDLSPANGIYLATLTASITEYNSDGSVADALTPSLPFYVLFEKDNADGSFDPSFKSQVSAADTYVAGLVPEPSVLASVAMVGLLARRRRSRC